MKEERTHMRKICIITSMIYPIPAVKGGAVEGLVELLVRVNEKYKKLDLTVVSLYDSGAEKESRKYKNTKFVYIKKKKWDEILSKKIFIYANKVVMKFLGKTIIDMPYIKAAMHVLKDEEFDIYVLEGGGDCYNFGYMHKIIEPDKLYVHFHGEVAGDKAIAMWFGKYITVSNYIARRLICNGAVDSRKVVVLPNCYDEDSMAVKYPREQIRERYGLASSDFVYIYWGRLLPQKGVYEMLEAFRLLVSETMDSTINLRLIIVGNASFGYGTYSAYDQKLQKLCEDKIIKDKIIFTGFLPHDEIGSILSSCDVGVIPSIWDDPAPLTIFEGMSKGLPLIAGNVGGIPEVIKDGNNGILVRWSPDYVMDLCTAMKCLRDSKELRMRFSNNARETVKEYNQDRYYNQFVEIVNA
ncbi:MAG: glycosyltransferase family 4 protein [Clostridium sp.]